MEVVLAVGLGLGLAYLVAAQRDPAAVSQKEWHEMAAPPGDSTLPKKHKVVVEMPSQGVAQIAVGYLPKPLGSGGTEKQGQYDPETGEIRITGQLARLSACYEQPVLSMPFRRVLRHEYGHAFVADWLESNDYSADARAYLGYTERATSADPSRYPDRLKPAVEEYRDLPRDVYGLPYLTSSFDEYLAESYARFVEGDEVPPETTAFLEEAVR